MAGTDAGTDVGSDAGTDAGTDAAPDPACEPTLGEAEVQLCVGTPTEFELITDGHELPLYVGQGGNLFGVNLLLHGMVSGE